MRLGELIVIVTFVSTIWLIEGRSSSGQTICTSAKDCPTDKICLYGATHSFYQECHEPTVTCDTVIKTPVKIELLPGQDVYTVVRPSGSNEICSSNFESGKIAGKPACCARPDTGIIFENTEKPVPSFTVSGEYKLCFSDGSGCDANTEYCARLVNSAQQSTYACFMNHVNFNENIKIRGILRSCGADENCQDEEFCFDRFLKNGSGICSTSVIPYGYPSVIGIDLKCENDPYFNQLMIKSGKSSDFFESFEIAKTKKTRVCIIRELMQEMCGHTAFPMKDEKGMFSKCGNNDDSTPCVLNKDEKRHRTFCGTLNYCCKTNLCPGTLFPMAGECGKKGAHCQRYGWCINGYCCPHYPLQGTYCSIAKAEEVEHELPVWTFNLSDGSLCSLGHYTWYREKFELRDTCSRELTCPEEDEICVKTQSVPAYGGHYYMCMVSPFINRSRTEEEKAEQFKTDLILSSIFLVTLVAIISGLLWIALH